MAAESTIARNGTFIVISYKACNGIYIKQKSFFLLLHCIILHVA